MWKEKRVQGKKDREKGNASSGLSLAFDLDTLTVAGGFWRAAAERRRLGTAAVIGCGSRGRVKRREVFVRYYVTRNVDVGMLN